MSTSASSETESSEPKGPASRLPTKVFEGHTAGVWSVAYFQDEKRIISGSRDNTVRIWDVESQKQEGEGLRHDFEAKSIALSPDERRLVSGGNGVVLWDLEGRTVMWKKEKSQVDGQCVAYSPDGRLIAARRQRAIALLNAETGEQIRDPLQLGERVFCLAFSPDGTRLAAGSENGNVRVFDVATGETVVGPFKAHAKVVTSLIYTFDRQQFITASGDELIRVWDAATGQEIGDPMLGHDTIRQIALNPNGQRLASSSEDSSVRVWDLKTRRQIGGPLQAQGNSYFLAVSWSPDGRSIIAGHTDGKIYLWDPPPLYDHTAIPQAPAPIASSPPALSTSRSRANSVSSSILNLPAGLSHALPQSPGANTGPDEDDDNWEYSTNESFDSVLDAPADVTQPTQRRRRRRRRRAPVASSSSAAVSRRQVPPAATDSRSPHHPPQNDEASTSTKKPTSDPDSSARAERSPPRGAPWTRRWTQASSLPRWTRTRRTPSKGCDEPHESQPNQTTESPIADSEASYAQSDAPGPSKPSGSEAKTSNIASNAKLNSSTPPERSSSFISRVRARFLREKHDHTAESIEMRPPQAREPRLPKYSPIVKVPLAQADPRLIIAPPRRKRRPRPVANAAVQEQGQEQAPAQEQGQLQVQGDVQKQGTAQPQGAVPAQGTIQCQEAGPEQAQGTVQNQVPGQEADSEEDDSDEGEAEEQEDAESFRDDGCLNALCFCEFLKWWKYRRDLRREQQDD
ncbi:quinon protein alcohol dehydrogenase-like superfamily [Hygrophoropsis aurantiaca]|uniref:Quinon protein alcohol dehydrogenase-like superfamily n=1 Tax=Hygrophoropsis aurantiaca TaxID=72124 RepID=A0ACB7ZX42_9AGAM|nr:quinon protein alcohol dehydrogenase-like superfamily [Hygrophoropsis aurantiaca]